MQITTELVELPELHPVWVENAYNIYKALYDMKYLKFDMKYDKMLFLSNLLKNTSMDELRRVKLCYNDLFNRAVELHKQHLMENDNGDRI